MAFDSNEPLASQSEAIGRSYDADKRVLQVGCRDAKVTVTPTLDTNAYADGDLLFNATELADLFAEDGGAGLIVSVGVQDKADNTAVPMDLVFFDTAPAAGTKNNAVAFTDAELAKRVATVPVLAADFKDFGGSKCADADIAPKQVRARSDSKSLWVAGVIRGAATYAASDLVITVELMRN